MKDIALLGLSDRALRQACLLHPEGEFDGFRQPNGSLRRTDQFADLFGVDRLTASAPTALGYLDDDNVKTHQPRRRDGDVLALHDAAVVSQNVDECFLRFLFPSA
ncbi:hypothetical protein [Mycobacterium sp.]|uniref:hypothetical protein n=1 Tax=Mycobacterium sp. TaxID=1785 RepID=UPI003D0A37EB